MKRTVFVTVLSAALLTGVSAYAQAELRHKSVVYTKVDFTDAREVATLYARLKHAARTVCDEGFRAPNSIAISDRQCEAEAVRTAVQRINEPALDRLHARREGRGVTMMAQK